jgi:hypothetical protein
VWRAGNRKYRLKEMTMKTLTLTLALIGLVSVLPARAASSAEPVKAVDFKLVSLDGKACVYPTIVANACC